MHTVDGIWYLLWYLRLILKQIRTARSGWNSRMPQMELRIICDAWVSPSVLKGAALLIADGRMVLELSTVSLSNTAQSLRFSAAPALLARITPSSTFAIAR